MPEINGIHHIALTVRDLEASEAFYTTLWGLGPVASMAPDGFTRRIFRLPSGLTLGLTKHDAGRDDEFSPLQAGLDHIGFACADRDAVVAWEAHLDAVGIEHSPIQDASFGTALVVKDPDGIAIEFYVSAQR